MLARLQKNEIWLRGGIIGRVEKVREKFVDEGKLIINQEIYCCRRILRVKVNTKLREVSHAR